MKKALVFVFVFVVLAVALIVVIYLIDSSYFKKESKPVDLSLKEESIEIGKEECFTVEERTVNGGSLSGIIENGETVRILFGYYDCNEIKKEDIVVYNYTGNENPIIKVVKALPGDKFSLKKTEDFSGWNIFVNNKIVTNSENLPYILNEKKHRVLSLYEEDYKGIIPEDSYLILSNIVSGAVDSTLFGLVHKDDISGKVERPIY